MKQNISFTSDNFNQQTPGFIKVIYRSLMFVTLMWAMAIEPRMTIPVNIAHDIDAWAIIANFGIYYFCQCFGFKQPEDPTKQTADPKNN